MKTAFTMIELVMVMVIIGILAVVSAMFLPNRTLLNETNSVVMQLKRVQAKAIGNNQFIFNSNSWKSDLNLIDDSCINLTKTDLNLKKSKITSTINKICFDNLGKPYKSNFEVINILLNSVDITITYRNKNRIIKILPYSGYIQQL